MSMNRKIKNKINILEGKSKSFLITLLLIIYLLISLLGGLSILTSGYALLVFILIYSIAFFKNKVELSKLHIFYLLTYLIFNFFIELITSRGEVTIILNEVFIFTLLFIILPSVLNYKEILDIFKFVVAISIVLIIVKKFSLGFEGVHIFYNKNSWAQTMIFPAFIAFYLYKLEKKAIYLICSFIFFFMIFTSFSRTAIIACLVFMFSYLLLSIKSNTRIKLLLVSLFFCLASIILFTNALTYLSDYLRIDPGNVFTNRDKLWRIGMRTFLENPIFGAGRTTPEQYLASYGFREYHNYYIEVLATRGIFNFIFFLIISYRSVKLSISIYKKNKTVGALYISFFFAIYTYILAESFSPYAFRYNSYISALLIYTSLRIFYKLICLKRKE